MEEEQPLPIEIDRYRVLRSLGRGGSGQVFQVADTLTGEHLALKWLQVSGLAEDRFNREYEAAVRLNHPNIVRVYHYGRYEDSPWFSMELVDGVQAQKYVQQVGWVGSEARTKEVLRIGAAVADALHYIHQRHLVHRDVKSSNVLVLPDGRVKLFDFGTARVLDAADITHEGEFVGTYAYASPEQCMGQAADSRSDLYNFGVFLYRLLSGRRPFLGDDPHELCRQHVEDVPPPLSELIPEIHSDLNALVMACLSKTPAARPSSARAIFKAIRKLAGPDPGLLGTLSLDPAAGQLVGREEDFGKLVRFLEESEPGALCTIEAAGQTDGQAFLGMAERHARGLDWRVFSCELTEDLGLYRLALLLRQVGNTFQGTPPKQVMRAIEQIGVLCRSWGGEEQAHQDTIAACGQAMFRERYLVDGRPVLIQLQQPGMGSRAVWSTISQWTSALVQEEVPIRIIVCLEPNSTIPWAECAERFVSVRTIRLMPLDEWQTGLLVGSLLHRRPPPPRVARRIHRVSGGLPEYVEVVVENLVANGLLESSKFSNRLQWADSESLVMPNPVRPDSAIVRRLATVSNYGRKVLEIIALAEQPLSAQEVSYVLQWEMEQIKELCKTLSDDGWLEPSEYNRWMIINPLYGSIVLDRLDEVEASAFLKRLLDVLIEKKPSKALIRGYLASNRLRDALPVVVDLAADQMEMLCPVSALEVIDLVYDSLGDESQYMDQDLERLHLLFARALAQTNPRDARLQTALSWLEGRPNNIELQTSVKAVRARIQRWLGHYPNYRKLLAEAWSGQKESAQAKTASDLARQLGDSHAMAGEVDLAKKWYDRGRRFAEEIDADLLWAESEVGRAGVLYAMGELQEAEFSAARALEVFDEAEHLPGMSLAIATWANALRHQGRLSQALEVLAAAAPILRASETPSFYLRVLIAMARCEMALGRLGRAQECLDELDAMVRPGEHLHLRLHVGLVRSVVRLLSGQGRKSLDLLTEVVQKATGAGLLIEAELGRSYLAEALWHSDQEKAIRYFTQSHARLEELGHLPALLEACVSRARVARGADRPDAIFAKVKTFLSEQPAELARMEWAVCDGLYLESVGRGAETSWMNASIILGGISEQLNEIDRSALELHPWSRAVRQGMAAAQSKEAG